MKGTIRPDLCIACGLCQVYAPEIFDYNDEGIVLFKNFPRQSTIEIPKKQIADYQIAYKKCPTRAILLEKD